MELKGNSIKNILKGVGIAIIITIISLIILAAILTYTSVPESVINPVTIVVISISILIGATITSRKIKKNSILNGTLVGLIYMLFIYTVSSILNWKFGLNIQAIILIAISTFFGILGRYNWCE